MTTTNTVSERCRRLTELQLVETRWGRVLLHLVTAMVAGHLRFAAAGIWREICRV